MYISRLAFHTVPGKTHEVEQHLLQLREMVLKAGGAHPRVSRAHFASLGAPDIVFEQDVPDLATLEAQLRTSPEVQNSIAGRSRCQVCSRNPRSARSINS